MCDTMVKVGRHGIWFAKNSDRDPNEGQALEWHTAKDHAPEETLHCTHLAIPQVARTHATLISRPFWGWGAEIGTNEHGVTIGNEAIFTRQRVPATGLTGMDLLRLALERARTAKAAIEVIRELAARHGQGGGCGHQDRGFRYFSSYIVCDSSEAHVVETSANDSETKRIEGTCSISNGLSATKLRKKVGDPLRPFVAGAARRQARTHQRTQAAESPRDLLRALRDHGSDESGVDVPRYDLVRGGLGAPCVHPGGLVANSQTTASWVADLGERAARHYVTGTAAPCTSIFFPAAVDKPLALGAAPRDAADDSLFWRHERIHRAALRAPKVWLPFLARERARLEARFFENPTEPKEAFACAEQWRARVGTALEVVTDYDERPYISRRIADRYQRDAGLARRG